MLKVWAWIESEIYTVWFYNFSIHFQKHNIHKHYILRISYYSIEVKTNYVCIF